MSSNKFRSRTKLSKCGYCGDEMLDDNLKTHCKNVHGKPKLVKGQQTIAFRSKNDEPKTKQKKTNEDECTASADGSSNDCLMSTTTMDEDFSFPPTADDPAKADDDSPDKSISTSTVSKLDSINDPLISTTTTMDEDIGFPPIADNNSPDSPDKSISISIVSKLDSIESQLRQLNLKIPDNFSDTLTNLSKPDSADSDAPLESNPAKTGDTDQEKLVSCKTENQLCEMYDVLVSQRQSLLFVLCA